MGDYFVCSKTDPVVETKAGKIRGFRINTTYTFHGIHYAEADRFQMPQPIKPVDRNQRRIGLWLCMSVVKAG